MPNKKQKLYIRIEYIQKCPMVPNFYNKVVSGVYKKRVQTDTQD